MSRSGHPLDPVLAPRSIAVVGASSDPRKRGFQVLKALSESGFKGDVYPVNPKGGELLGRTVFLSVRDLPGVPDLALVCTPASTVPATVAECGAAGVRGAVVLAVGFKESGEEGEALERALLEAARTNGVRVVGPNTSGLLNLPLGLNLIGARGVRPGRLSLLVQSGNMALSLMNEATARSSIGIAVVIGVGNQTDLGFAEYLEWLGQHEETAAIIAYVEGFQDGRAFLEAAARVARLKPIVVIKGARSSAGQEAARSHTGSVAGEYDRLRAAFRQVGVVECSRTDELLHVAETLATQPPAPPGTGVAVLSDGGGQGTLASDALTELDVPLARLSDDTRDALRALLGRAAAVGNPVDLAGASDADPGVFAEALAVLADDPGVGVVLVVGLFGGYGIRFSSDLTEAEEDAAGRMPALMSVAGKALVMHSMYASHDSAPLRVLRDRGVPVVESLEVACRSAAEVWRRGQSLAKPAWVPRGRHAPDAGPDAPEAEPRAPDAEPDAPDAESHAAPPSVTAARADGRTVLTEPEGRELLQGFGLPFRATTLCSTRDEAARAVAALNGPTALKVVAAGIVHKTDAGGVVLDVRTPEAAASAFDRILASGAAWLSAHGHPPEIDGVLVGPMLRPPLVELLVGARRDQDVGPVLTVGAGGVWVEVLRDVTHRMIPLSDSDYRAMLDELTIGPLLEGARGRPKADFASVVSAVKAVAESIWTVPAIAEVEINPLFVYEDGIEAVDARVFLTELGAR